MTDPQAILAKIRAQDRSECDSELIDALDAWEKRIDELEGLKALADNFLVKERLALYRARIGAIDERLTSERKMPELVRENLLDQKDLYRDFINSFDIETAADALAAEVDKYLES